MRQPDASGVILLKPKKRLRRPAHCCAGGSPIAKSAQVPKQIVEVNGNAALAMVDTGCSRTILAQEMIENRERHRTTEVIKMNGDTEAVEEARNVKINVEVASYFGQNPGRTNTEIWWTP